MNSAYLKIEKSSPLQGESALVGAKNAVLVLMASLVLTSGKSVLKNVPASADVFNMIQLLEKLGAHVSFFQAENRLEVDTSSLHSYDVPYEIMKKMRASILVMGPLLARFGRAHVSVPGGCSLGMRPIDYHVKGLTRLGAHFEFNGEYLEARTLNGLRANTIIFDYPSVGATENVVMAAVLTRGTTRIINVALEPEVLDLISALRAMGSQIEILPPATLMVHGVDMLHPIIHEVIPDRLEAGALLMAAAITGGEVTIPTAPVYAMEMVLMKLEEMGHSITWLSDQRGVHLKAIMEPKAVSFKTAPYPGFPTDLQAPMMALQAYAHGRCEIHETVFENRLLHVPELAKMGAQIRVEHDKAVVTGVDELYGASVIATDIRASCALALAGLVAQGTTIMSGVSHWMRGYEALEEKLALLGGRITLYTHENEAGVTTQVTQIPEYNQKPL